MIRTLRERIDIPGLLLLAAAAAFLLTWWNRYLSPTVGFELMFGAEWARGHVPYRDYYLPVQPAWPLASAAGEALFGRRLIVFWLAGALLRLLAVGCLYRWLRRLTPAPWAAFATLAAFVVSCTDVVDFPAWYNYLTIVFALLGGFAAVKSLEAAPRAGLAWAALAGLVLGAHFLTKQTTGALAGLATLAAAAVALQRLHGTRRAVQGVGVMGLTVAACLAAVALWLVRVGAWEAYVDQVYVSGPSSKGGLAGSFARIGRTTLEEPMLLGAWLLALLAAGVVALLGSCRFPRAVLFALVGAVTLLLTVQAGRVRLESRTVMLAAADVGQGACPIAAAWAALAVLRGARDPWTLRVGILGSVGFAVNLGLALSWPTFEPMALPGLALALALAFRAAPRPRAALALATILLVTCAGWRKYEWPSTWGFWAEPPVALGTREPEVAELSGFRLSPQTAAFFDGVTRLVREHSGPDEPIWVFPHMPIFYGLADRPRACFSYMQWPDVCPDHVAAQDARTLLVSPPAVIVMLALPAEAYEGEERAFRVGRRGGHRRLLEAFEMLRPAYVRVGSFAVPGAEGAAGKPVTVDVWARRPGSP